MQGTHFGVLVFAVLCGCVPDTHLEIFLPPDSNARAVVLAVSGRERQLFAADTEGRVVIPMALEQDEHVQIDALLYAFALADAGLVAGPLSIATDTPSRALPTPTRSLTAGMRFGDSASVSWSDFEFAESELADLRFDLSELSCSDPRACLSSFPADRETLRCSMCESMQAVSPPSSPMMPAPVSPPSLLPCPSGWTIVEPVDVFDVPWCAPAAFEENCDEGAPFYGETGCIVVGNNCPLGEFADENEPAALYVSANAGVNGDGTKAAPLRSLTAAMALVPPGGTIILGRGVHTASIAIDRAVTLRGVCASATTIAGSLRGVANDVSIADVTIDGLRHGLIVEGQAQNVILAGVVLRAPDHALIIRDGSTIGVDRVLISGSDLGIFVEENAELDASRLTIRDTRIGANILGRAHLESTIFFRMGGEAIRVTGAGGLLEVNDSLIADGGSEASAFSILAAHESHLILRRVKVGARYEGIYILHEAHAELEDLLVAGITTAAGTGILVHDGCWVRLRRATVRQFGHFGISLWHRALASELSDVVVRESSDTTEGITVRTSSKAVVARALVRDGKKGYVVGEGAAVELSDIQAHGLLREGGVGLQIIAGAQVTVDRAVFVDPGQTAIVSERAVGHLADIVARGGPPELGLNIAGIFLGCAELELERVHVSGFQAGIDFNDLELPCDHASFLKDATIEDGLETFSTVGVRIKYGHAHLERVDIDLGSKLALDVDADLADIADLRVTGPIRLNTNKASLTRVEIANDYMTTFEWARGAGSLRDFRLLGVGPSAETEGLRLSATSSVTIERFHLSGTGRAGVVVGGFVGPLTLRDGLIENAVSAVEIPLSERHEVELRDVRVRDVKRAVSSPL